MQAWWALGYIPALLRHASYHAGVRFGSKGRDFALWTGRRPHIWLDEPSSVYQTGMERSAQHRTAVCEDTFMAVRIGKL